MERFIAQDRATMNTLPTLLARGGAILLAAVVVSSLAGAFGDRAPTPAMPPAPVDPAPPADVAALRAELDQVRGALMIERMKNRRADAIQGFSARYAIPADLSAAIYDHAITEGIDPAVAFRLVRVESNFQGNAKSPAKAIGFTQLKLGTARHYEPWVTERDLRTRDVNLRIGFRFLRDLVRQYGGDVDLALLAYNRGPARVNEYLDHSGDPDNGYASKVLNPLHVGN